MEEKLAVRSWSEATQKLDQNTNDNSNVIAVDFGTRPVALAA